MPFVSVVIAARNEAKRIKPALDSLAMVDYPPDLHEVIWVDDNSVDATANFILDYVKDRSNWQLIKLQNKGQKFSGKKLALDTAIKQAKGEIILTTDADCRVQKDWIGAILNAFNKDTIMVLGHSLLEKKKGMLDKLLRFDNLFSGIMVAAPAKAGYAVSSVGRNMAYRKEAYIQSGGYSELVHFKSGDDVHLTELFRRNIKGKIVFCSNSESFTFTKRPDTLKEIMHQQIRKNSKLFKKSFSSILLTFFLFLYHFLLILFPFLFYQLIDLWIVLIVLKLGAEFITLFYAASVFKEKDLTGYIPAFQVFYPLYVILLGGIASLFSFEWKGRK